MNTKNGKYKRYFKFLYRIVDVKSNHDNSDYTLLLEHLHNIDFYSFVPNDDNRAEDGKKLRIIFDEEANTGLSLSPEEPCSVLEMLIGLSFRMENELLDGTSEKKVDECFWELIDNLGLTWTNNFAYVKHGGSDKIDHLINILLSRKYAKNGRGGIFPMKNTPNDQREVEIWYQMSEYLLEKYDF